MGKNIKTIRKISNTRVFLITDDNGVVGTVLKDFTSDIKEIKHLTSSDNINFKSLTSNDIIILDMDIEKDSFDKISSKASSSATSTPKIVISSKSGDEEIYNAINLQAYTFLIKPFNSMNLKLSILMCINQTKRSDKIELNHGIYFDEYRDQFFKKGGAVIDFTRLEKGFLKLLIDKRDEITNYDTIKEVVWKGKEMSIYTMRNIVNKIRQKTYYEIIRNHSSRGYTIDILKK